MRGVTPFRGHLIIEERVHGLDQIRLRRYSGEEHRIAFPEASYTASLGSNPEFAPAAYRIGYTSMVTPVTVYDYQPAEDRLETLKVQEIPSGYRSEEHTSELQSLMRISYAVFCLKKKKHYYNKQDKEE